MKTLKFRPALAQMIIDDKKTTTWRLFDDKDLQVGDVVELMNWETKVVFGRAVIVEVDEKPIKDLDDRDWEGHERFSSDEEMYAKYREYYPGREVGPETLVKILHFTKITDWDKDFPEIIKEVGFEFPWKEEKVWALEIPVEDMPISELTWHFDIPFHWHNGGKYNLTSWEIIRNPEAHKKEYERTMACDLKYPIDIMENKGRWLILDGLHRLMKEQILKSDTVKVRKIPERKFLIYWDSMKPFTDNIIFLDTEFSDLNPYKGEVLSVGIVKPNGDELYLELEHDGPASDWVKEHILPTLNGPRVSREEAKRKIREFVGKGMPYAVAYVNQYDDVYLNKLFQGDEKPWYWLPIDFASMMFAVGLDPESQLAEEFSGYREHHALDDAKLLRSCYMKFFE